MRRLILLIALCLGFAFGLADTASAQVPEGYAPAQTYGMAAKKPVLAAACHFCPRGALADVVIAAMKSYGWDIQGCFNCSGANSVRLAGRRQIPPLRSRGQVAEGTPPPPYAPVDLGVMDMGGLYNAYHGLDAFKDDGPYKNLRLVARIEQPAYLVVAVKDSAGITDLAQIKAKRMPVRIYNTSPEGEKILAYYGLTKEALASWGGSIGPAARGAANPEDGAGGAAAGRGRGTANAAPAPENHGNRAGNVPDYDVYIHPYAVMANNPESNLMYQLTQVQKLDFLQLPEDLLNQLAEWPQQRVTMPQAYFAGVDRDIQTVGRGGEAVFVRDDTPDNFSYDLAKAMDKKKSLLKWRVLPFSYDPDTVTAIKDVPLAPGAARYYREAGYIK